MDETAVRLVLRDAIGVLSKDLIVLIGLEHGCEHHAREHNVNINAYLFCAERIARLCNAARSLDTAGEQTLKLCALEARALQRPVLVGHTAVDEREAGAAVGS